MAVPTVATYSAAAVIAAHTLFRDLIDTGAGEGSVKVRNSSDELLATIPLTDPCGTVNGTTGQFTFSVAGIPNASATGTAAYVEICDVAGAVHLAMPVQIGGAPVSGYAVFTSSSLVAGSTVEMVSATIG